MGPVYPFFAPLGLNWITFAASEADSIGEFLNYVLADAIGLIVFVYLFFVRAWWAVAIGYLGLAYIAAIWFTRTI